MSSFYRATGQEWINYSELFRYFISSMTSSKQMFYVNNELCFQIPCFQSRILYFGLHLVSHLSGMIIRYEILLKRFHQRGVPWPFSICKKTIIHAGYKHTSHLACVFRYCKDPCASAYHNTF